MRDYFGQVGEVADVQLIRDRVGGKSKGFGYVEFAELESVPKAMLLNGAPTSHQRLISAAGPPLAVQAC